MLFKIVHQRIIKDGGIYLLNLVKYVQTIIKPMYYYCMRETGHTVFLIKSNADIHFSFCDTDLLVFMLRGKYLKTTTNEGE